MRIIVFTALSLAFIVAQPIRADESERYTRRQLHKPMREADTPEKQQRVSAYRRRMAKDLKVLAQADKSFSNLEWYTNPGRVEQIPAVCRRVYCV